MTGNSERELERAAAAIDGASMVSLACHVNPDGDALGSMLGLHHALANAGRASVASFSRPFVVGPHYRQLPGLELICAPAEFPAEPEVMVTFDCGSLDRLGDLVEPAKAAHELVVLDHHASNQQFGSINVIDHEAAATAVIVYRLLEAMGLALTRDAAVCLYAGLVCDTGRFQYGSTTREVFDIARALVEYDIPIADLNRSLFEEHRFVYLRMLGEILGRAVLVPERRFVWAALTQRDLARHGVSMEEVEGLIDVIRRTREAEVACVLKEEPDGTYRVSLRSVGEVDVCAIAERHGGGGHRFAAGFTAPGPADSIVAAIEAGLPVDGAAERAQVRGDGSGPAVVNGTTRPPATSS